MAIGSCKSRHTGVLGLRDNLSQQLGEVRQVLTQEAGLQHKSLTGVVGLQLTAQQLGFAGNAQGRSLGGALQWGRQRIGHQLVLAGPE